MNTNPGPPPLTGPYEPTSATAEALVLAQRADGASGAELQKLAEDKKVNLSHIMNGLKRGDRVTETKIGKEWLPMGLSERGQSASSS